MILFHILFFLNAGVRDNVNVRRKSIHLLFVASSIFLKFAVSNFFIGALIMLCSFGHF